MELSKRLYTVAAAVTPGHRVADVGTDHGYVPIYLVQKRRCPKAYALDVNEGPLQRAEEHIREKGLADTIETRLGDGLAALSPSETDTIVIAGMGGELMCRILKEAPQFMAEGKELVLQPQSEWFKVRRLLYDFAYEIAQEWFVKEDGKYYVILKARPNMGSGQTQEPSAFAECYGSLLLEERHPVLLEYLQNEMEKKQNILNNINMLERRAGNKEADDQKAGVRKRMVRQNQLEEEIKEIQKYLEYKK